MKTLITAITLSVVSAASFAAISPSAAGADTPSVRFVFRGDGLVPVYTNTSNTTRAEVIAELKASRERMDYVHVGDELVPRNVFKSQRSRANVRAEAQQAALASAQTLRRPLNSR
jgi:hypothetical protein